MSTRQLALYFLVTGSLILTSDRTFAQPPASGGAPPANTDSTRVVIKRDAVSLMAPAEFRAPLSLSPTRSLEVRALVEGVVQNIRVQPGSNVSAQEEIVRIESATAAKKLERAKASLKAASLKRDLAKTETDSGKQPKITLDLAEAEVDVAEADLELAQLNFDNTSVRAAFAGEVSAVETVEGAFVNEGDLLFVLRDPVQMTVHLPVNRNEVKQGDTLEVQLDSEKASGKVQAILPLSEKWQPLRQIVESAVIAVVVIENKDGKYQDGQTAYSPIVPRQPVIEVANSTLRNSETGTRVVQVLRDLMVRDINVELLGPVGEGRSFIAGPFEQGDEIILESSEALFDGTVVQHLVAAPVENATSGRTPQPNTTQQPAGVPGF